MISTWKKNFKPPPHGLSPSLMTRQSELSVSQLIAKKASYDFEYVSSSRLDQSPNDFNIPGVAAHAHFFKTPVSPGLPSK